MKRKIALSLCLALLLSFVCVLYVGAEPTTSPPANLTGYTITVPYGWSALSGVGDFDLTGSFTDINISSDPQDGLSRLAIGYLRQNSSSVEPTADYISYAIGGLYTGFIDPSLGFSFTVTGGGSVEDSNLINWLFDNNATFDNGSSPDPDPEPTVSSISIGSYSLITPLTDIPNVDWMDGSGYSYYYTANGTISYGGRVATISGFSFDLDYFQTSSIYDLTVSVTLSDYTEVDIALIEIYNATRTVTPLNGFRYIFFSEDVVLDSNSYETFFDIFEFYDPDEVETPDNPWTYILEKVIDALKVELWGEFSPWDIFSTLTGIFIVVWILKLIAGG